MNLSFYYKAYVYVSFYVYALLIFSCYVASPLFCFLFLLLMMTDFYIDSNNNSISEISSSSLSSVSPNIPSSNHFHPAVRESDIHLSHLWQLSHQYISCCSSLSRYYSTLFIRLLNHRDYGAVQFVNQRFCKYCCTILIPHMTCHVTIKSFKKLKKNKQKKKNKQQQQQRQHDDKISQNEKVMESHGDIVLGDIQCLHTKRRRVSTEKQSNIHSSSGYIPSHKQQLHIQSPVTSSKKRSSLIPIPSVVTPCSNTKPFKQSRQQKKKIMKNIAIYKCITCSYENRIAILTNLPISASLTSSTPTSSILDVLDELSCTEIRAEKESAIQLQCQIAADVAAEQNKKKEKKHKLLNNLVQATSSNIALMPTSLGRLPQINNLNILYQTPQNTININNKHNIEFDHPQSSDTHLLIKQHHQRPQPKAMTDHTAPAETKKRKRKGPLSLLQQVKHEQKTSGPSPTTPVTPAAPKPFSFNSLASSLLATPTCKQSIGASTVSGKSPSAIHTPQSMNLYNLLQSFSHK